MTDSLKKLYNHLILERQKDPSGFEKRENAHVKLEAYNPLCGDQYKLYLDFDGEVITQATYHGYGCALSKASTSLLIEGLRGKNTDECLEYIRWYRHSLDGHGNPSELIKALALAKNFPGRQQCTVLSWEAVSNYLMSNQ